MDFLKVNNRTITFKNKVINTANITSIDIKEINVKRIKAFLILGILSLLTGVPTLIKLFVTIEPNQLTTEDSIEFGTSLFSILIGILLLTAGRLINRYRLKKNRQFLLVIITNAGRTQLFRSKELEFVQNVKDQIQNALENSLPETALFNITNNTYINIIEHVDIKHNEYKGMSPDQMEFLSTQFQSALNQLIDHINSKGSEEEKIQITNITEELKKKRPKKTILIKSFDFLKKNVPKGINIIDAIQIINQGIEFFTN